LTRTSPSGEIALLPAELKETVSYWDRIVPQWKITQKKKKQAAYIILESVTIQPILEAWGDTFMINSACTQSHLINNFSVINSCLA
jgi:hypothetical protein